MIRALRDRGGQFIPITYMVLFTAVFFLTAVVNLYQVTRAKLQAQNIADEVALAVAALQAKSINVVIDRDEWLNHMYPDDQIDHTKKEQLPGISWASDHPFHSTKADDSNPDAYQYAQLVQTINQAQLMFREAYNRFLAVKDGTTGQNYGAGGLSAILHEISALKDPNVRVVVFNNNEGEKSAKEHQEDLIRNGKANFPVKTDNIEAQPMAAVPFITEDVHLKQKGNETLTEVLYGKGKAPPDPRMRVGWMRPDWGDATSALTVNTGTGQSGTTQIGAGALVIKHIQLLNPFFRDLYVTAEAKAYVVQGSGHSVKKETLKPGADGKMTGDPPDHFRPTYYVKLGAHS